MTCRTLTHVYEAADQTAATMPPLTQAQANLAAAILTIQQAAAA